jgi:hypothetical protein
VGVSQVRKTEQTTGFFRPVNVVFFSSSPSGVFFDPFSDDGSDQDGAEEEYQGSLMGRVRKMLQAPSEILMRVRGTSITL